jgi:predicted RNA-binding protein with PIN domain
MLWLIDGYNLMHAVGAISREVCTREAFRRRRRTFLNRLADALGAERASETTVVFDASVPPGDFPLEATYKGMTIVFAVADESADARIEKMIATHSAPKSLSVISSDRRIRQAARRRKARTLAAGDFLDELDRFQSQRSATRRMHSAENARPSDDKTPPAAGDAQYWMEAFANLETAPENDDAFLSSSSLLTDAEIARIEREIDEEN